MTLEKLKKKYIYNSQKYEKGRLKLIKIILKMMTKLPEI